VSVKRRLIFTLLYADGYFMLSRNFRLQKAGGIEWLEKNYNLKSTAQAIDELVVLNVSRRKEIDAEFPGVLRRVVQNVFVPVTAGGGIRYTLTAEELLNSGADKLILNTAIEKQPELVRELVRQYGSQCVVASIDYQKEDDSYVPLIEQGSIRLKSRLKEHLMKAKDLDVGEIYLNSVDREGYDIDISRQIPSGFGIPIIIAGGAGNPRHFVEALRTGKFDAVATANIFNFVGRGLLRARTRLIEEELNMADIVSVEEALDGS
jgi:cyclase